MITTLREFWPQMIYLTVLSLWNYLALDKNGVAFIWDQFCHLGMMALLRFECPGICEL